MGLPFEVVKGIRAFKVIVVPADRFDATVQRWVHKGLTVDPISN